jgi:hypothetical protein
MHVNLLIHQLFSILCNKIVIYEASRTNTVCSIRHRENKRRPLTGICIIIPMDPLQEDSCLSSASQLVGHHILHGEIHCITMLSEFTTRARPHTLAAQFINMMVRSPGEGKRPQLTRIGTPSDIQPHRSHASLHLPAKYEEPD